MVKTETVVIDNRQVITTQLPARRCLALKTQLIKLLGPAVVKMLSSSSGGIPINAKSLMGRLDKDVDLSKMAESVEMLCVNLSPDTLFQLILDTLASTKVAIEGKGMYDVTRDTFDIVFDSGLLFMYKVWWVALKVNYSDFFGESGIGSLKMPTMSIPPSAQK